MSNQILKSPAAFEAFGRAVFAQITERCADGDIGEDDEAFLELAQEHGLCVRVPYDPEMHGACDAEIGDNIWWWGRREAK